MRRMDNWLASLLWVASASLLPLTALEPVGAPASAMRPAYADAACADGSAHLAMGCSAVTL